jgi:acylphosphatase
LINEVAEEMGVDASTITATWTVVDGKLEIILQFSSNEDSKRFNEILNEGAFSGPVTRKIIHIVTEPPSSHSAAVVPSVALLLLQIGGID